MREPSDEELVRRIRGGDRDAIGTLFGRYRSSLRAQAKRRLRGFVRRRVADSDVVQDAFLGALASLDAFEDHGEGSFERWIQGILRHKAGDQVRRHVGTAKRGAGHEVSHDGDALHPGPASPSPTPSVDASAREEASRVCAAVYRLPDDYRMVLECAHRSGMTLAEIGAITGRSPNAVCKVYGRAVRELGRILAES